ncbi:sodium-coupled monocarboxylate transporter 2-like isoform X2 [Prorops nasuta]|uniref:sodium-coupled monocarboxylate transporter 2-like isoform X2 n=1 Tax=Prorops nasuta TaxID=863751 RepID=UPI0034CE7E38
MAPDSRELQGFGWMNYAVFGLTLMMNTLISVIVVCFGKKQKTIEEYVLGGRKISFLLIAISLVTSHVSAITLIGVPTEVYLYGTLYWLLCPSMVIVGFLTIKIFIPVYRSLEITNLQQYLQLRFTNRVRLIGTILYTINTLLFLPILIYGPALAFSQVSGINLHIISTSVCIVCTFYTMLGGLKGIVWTDGLQAFIMVCSCLTWVAMGTKNAGSIATVWERAKEGHRLRLFEMNPSPLEARTFWTMTLGSIGLWMANSATNPLMVQRFLAVSSLKKTKKAMLLYTLGIIFVNSMSCYTGLIIYSLYGDCDPILTGAIEKPNQLMPYFIMDTVGHIPGLPGLFVAAIFSSALSSLSAAMNALSGIIYEEFIMRMFNKPARFGPTVYIKLQIIAIGILCLLLIFVVDKLGELIEGAIAGVSISLLTMSVIVGGTQISKFNKMPPFQPDVSGCTNFTLDNANFTSQWHTTDQSNTFVLFKISFVYYTLLGCLIVLAVGTITSLLTRTKGENLLNANLIAPPFRFLLPTVSKNRDSDVKLLKTDETTTGSFRGNGRVLLDGA